MRVSVRPAIFRNSREESVLLSARKPEPAGTGKDFTDVPSTNNFYKAIKLGVEQGITGGYTGARKGQFGPNDNCTRGQIAMFLWRYAKSPKPAPTFRSQNPTAT